MLIPAVSHIANVTLCPSRLIFLVRNDAYKKAHAKKNFIICYVQINSMFLARVAQKRDIPPQKESVKCEEP